MTYCLPAYYHRFGCLWAEEDQQPTIDSSMFDEGTFGNNVRLIDLAEAVSAKQFYPGKAWITSGW